MLSEALDAVAREDEAEAAEGIAWRAQGLREALAVVLSRDDPAYVYGVETRGRANVLLSAAPVDVSVPLRERLWDGLHAAVLTSATLTVDGAFTFFAQRVGLTDAERLDVASSFDHASQAELYLPKGMPEPSDPAFAEAGLAAVRPLLEITQGRAFLLFTSYAMLARFRMAELTREDGAREPAVVLARGSLRRHQLDILADLARSHTRATPCPHSRAVEARAERVERIRPDVLRKAAIGRMSATERHGNGIATNSRIQIGRGAH